MWMSFIYSMAFLKYQEKYECLKIKKKFLDKNILSNP
jgi:hypothetical protein